MWYIRGHQMQHSHHALRVRAELIVLATVFFIAWNKIDVLPNALSWYPIEYLTSHL